jgi:hypothetical protein
METDKIDKIGAHLTPQPASQTQPTQQMQMRKEDPPPTSTSTLSKPMSTGGGGSSSNDASSRDNDDSQVSGQGDVTILPSMESLLAPKVSVHALSQDQ